MIATLGSKLGELAVVLGLLANVLAAAPAEYVVEPDLGFKSPIPSEIQQVVSDTTTDRMGQTGAEIGEKTWTQGQIRTLVVQEARKRGISDFLALELAHVESRFEPDAKNPSSSATGIYQFLLGTWNANCSGDRKNPEDNIICAMEILKEPTNIRHWTIVTSTRQHFLNLKLITCSNFSKNICQKK